MSTEFWIQMIAYGVTFGTFAGIVKTKLKYIEDKDISIARACISEYSLLSLHRAVK